MATQAIPLRRFVRKTRLDAHEYRKNFRQIDDDVIAALTSPEADAVTPLMSKIYLRLLTAPGKYWEQEGVLHFEAEMREGKRLTAWGVLCALLNVSSATANKALAWLHAVEVIGYFAGKNGVGVRIFLNRAASSIGNRQPPGEKKILAFSRASSADARASRNEAAFKETYSDQEVLEPDGDSLAPTSGADHTNSARLVDRTEAADTGPPGVSVDEIVRRLREELEPSLRATAAQAAKREHERTREWLEERGLPKAARVAQREAYNVLKRYGAFNPPDRRARSELAVGRHERASYAPRPLAPDELQELAEICVSMLNTHGQPIEATLAGVGVGAGGYLLPEDAPRVRELALLMVCPQGGGEKRS